MVMFSVVLCCVVVKRCWCAALLFLALQSSGHGATHSHHMHCTTDVIPRALATITSSLTLTEELW